MIDSILISYELNKVQICHIDSDLLQKYDIYNALPHDVDANTMGYTYNVRDPAIK